MLVYFVYDMRSVRCMGDADELIFSVSKQASQHGCFIINFPIKCLVRPVFERESITMEYHFTRKIDLV